MIQSQVLKASLNNFAQKSFNSKASIAEYLNSPSWSSSQLFGTSDITDELDTTATEFAQQKPSVDAALVSKLVKQAGLPPVEPNSTREAEILKDLQDQLVFVDHICEVNTEGIEPLVRLGDPVINLSFSEMKTPIEPKDSKIKWNPTDLAAEKNGNLYVLKEGLRHEE